MDAGSFRTAPPRPLHAPQQRAHLRRLLDADAFETLLSKVPASKRFGIEGAESLVVGLHWLMRSAATAGVHSVDLGMAHRGRLERAPCGPRQAPREHSGGV